MQKLKLTKRTVDAVPTPEAGETRVWDSELAGFCLRVYPAGRKVFAVKYRVRGVQRWLSLGDYGDGDGCLTPDAARKEAAAAIVDARRGNDPAAARRKITGLTVGGLIDLYLKDGPKDKEKKRAATWVQDASNLNRHVRKLIGQKVIVTRDDIVRMVADITDGKTATNEKTIKHGRAIVSGGAGVADRTFSTTRAMFNWAIDKGHYSGPNPCARIQRRVAASVERYLSDAQARALLDALDALEADRSISTSQAAIFRLLLLTGARRMEIVGLRWSEVDLERKRLVLPPERTKAGGKTGDRRILLNSPAVAILTALSATRGRNRHVFPAAKGKSGHTRSEAKVWREKVLPRARLSGVRIHDLRHSFASFALADGASLPMIGKALGHASSRATERYAHLADEPVRDMAERIGSRFEGET